jgi:hypothetical protein
VSGLYGLVSRLQLIVRNRKVAREKLDFIIAFGEALCSLDNSSELLALQGRNSPKFGTNLAESKELGKTIQYTLSAIPAVQAVQASRARSGVFFAENETYKLRGKNNDRSAHQKKTLFPPGNNCIIVWCGKFKIWRVSSHAELCRGREARRNGG